MFFILYNFCSAFTTLPYIIQTTIKFTFNKLTSSDLIWWHRKDDKSGHLLRLVSEPVEVEVGWGYFMQPEPRYKSDGCRGTSCILMVQSFIQVVGVGGWENGERPSFIPYLRIFGWYFGLHDLKSLWDWTQGQSYSGQIFQSHTSQQEKIPNLPSQHLHYSWMNMKTSLTCFHTQSAVFPF